MKIAICDDDSATFAWIEEAIEEKLGAEVECEFYVDSQLLLEDFRGGQRYDVYFLDVCMPKCDGIELAAAIRRADPQALIIFVSGYEEYGYACIACQPLCFVKKSNLDADLDKALRAVSKTLAMREKRLAFKKGHGNVLLSCMEILFIKGSRNNYEVHTTAGVYNFYGTLAQVEKILPDYIFVRCHRSHIINIHHIKGLGPRGVWIDGNDDPLPVNQKGLDQINCRLGEIIRAR
ncbi:MAG: LytTR family DNA-binding domain-containing protein [Peptococcaceae bacterium]|nr:LytTR family DNA-binding domain-containing protein [Peptococcaceae bacterium]